MNGFRPDYFGRPNAIQTFQERHPIGIFEPSCELLPKFQRCAYLSNVWSQLRDYTQKLLRPFERIQVAASFRRPTCKGITAPGKRTVSRTEVRLILVEPPLWLYSFVPLKVGSKNSNPNKPVGLAALQLRCNSKEKDFFFVRSVIYKEW